MNETLKRMEEDMKWKGMNTLQLSTSMDLEFHENGV